MSNILEFISKIGIVPLVVLDNKEDAVHLGKALFNGGIPIAEVTLRTDAAIDVINEMSKIKGLCVGAGTVHTVEQAKNAIKAGATFIVTPGINVEVVKWCVNNDVLIIPGVVTPTDLELALSLGLTHLKFFPAENFGGVKTLKAFQGPFPNMKFLPTGGINEENFLDYLNLTNVLAVGGSFTIPNNHLKNKDWNKITETCRSMLIKKHGFKIAHIGINSENQNKGYEVALLLAKIFGFSIDEKKASYFVSPELEIMHGNGAGTHGHIAVKCNDVENAIEYFKSIGVELNPKSYRYDENGKINFAYLKDEIAGFAFHLV